MENQDVQILSEVKYDLAVSRDPKQVLAEAMTAAKALKEVISLKSKPVMFNGEQYLEFEDWQTVGKFYGVTAKIVSTEFVDFGGAKGFSARAEAILITNGMAISGAEAMCLNDEDKWTSRTKYEWKNGVKTKVGEVPVPLFQLRSMAQTRACAKCLRNVLAWVVVLAGYKATPAEEMTGTEHTPAPEHQAPKRKSESISPEDLKAAEERLAKEKAKQEELKAQEVAPLSNGEGVITVKGVIDMYYPPKGKGPHCFVIGEHKCKTFDAFIPETLLKYKELGESVTLACREVESKGYKNLMILEVISQS